MRHEVYMGAARWPKPPNNSLQPWTPAPHRRCGENARTPAQTAHLPSRRTSGRCGGRCQGVLGLRLTRLACGKLKRALPARMRENERTVARAAGQLPAQNAGRVPTGLLTCTAPPGRTPGRCAVRRTLALPKDTPAQYRRCWVGTMWRAAPGQCQGVQVSRSSRPLGGRRSC